MTDRKRTLAPLAPLPPAPVPFTAPLQKNADPVRSCRETKHSSEKSVTISLPPVKRIKRQRQEQAELSVASCSKVIEGLNLCVSRDERLVAITAAREAFNHGEENVHDNEIEKGADSALCKHLAFLLLKKEVTAKKEEGARKKCKSEEASDEGDGGDDVAKVQQKRKYLNDRYSEEITLTCESLERIYRCSPKVVESSFRRIGSELLPLLISVADSEIRQLGSTTAAQVSPESCGSNSSITSEESTISVGGQKENVGAANSITSCSSTKLLSETTIKAVTKTMGHFARIGSATEPMAYHPGLLSTLKRAVDPVGSIPAEARLNALWIIANLACNGENMVMMACHPGLLSSLVGAALPPSVEDDGSPNLWSEYYHAIRAQSIATRALLNLSWSPENKIPMSEHTQLIEVLLKILATRTSPWIGKGRGVSTILLQSRRFAAGALRNTAGAPRRNKYKLCQYGDGFLLDVLCDAARNDPDGEVKEKVFAAFYHLACADTAETFVLRFGLLDVLAWAAASNISARGVGGSSKIMALRALKVLKENVTPDMECYYTLQEVLHDVDSAQEEEKPEEGGKENSADQAKPQQ